MQMVKSTVNIPVKLKEELNKYVKLNMVPSFSSGVNMAIEAYLKELRRIDYDRQMAVAANDRDFIERTMDCQNAMSDRESGAPGEW